MSDAPYKLTLCDSDVPGRAVYSVETPAGERFDTVQIHSVGLPADTEWLWDEHIPLGKVTVIEGAPGSGKSRVAFDLAARAASRLPWPDGTPNALPAGDVLVISRHEEAGCITAQVRRAAGEKGDARNVFRFKGFATALPEADRYGDRPVAFPFDLEALDYHLECNMSIGVVIIDPLTDFCRTPGLLAETLHQLNELAARHRIAFIATVPAECRTDREGRLRVTSRWPTQAARCVWCLVADPDDPRRWLLVARRTNYCREPDGLAFRHDEEGVAWEAQSAISPIDPLGALSDCDRCLHDLLSAGAVAASALFRLGAERGFSPRQLRSAGQRLGIARHRVGYSEGGYWAWSLPNEGLPIAAAVALAETPQHLTVDTDESAAADFSCAASAPDLPAAARNQVQEEPIEAMIVEPAIASGPGTGDPQQSHIAELQDPDSPANAAPAALLPQTAAARSATPGPTGQRRKKGKYERRRLRHASRQQERASIRAGAASG